MRIKSRLLFAGFIVSFLIVAALTLMSFFHMTRLNARIAQVEHTHTVINTINHLSDALDDLNKASFWFITGGQPHYRRLYEAAGHRWNRLSDSLQRLTLDNKAQQSTMVLLKSDMALYQTSARRLMSNGQIPATELIGLEDYKLKRQQFDTTLSRLAHMKARENSLLAVRTEARSSYLQLTSWLIRTFTAIFGVLTLLLFLLLLREFRRRTTFQRELQQKVTEIAQSKRELEHIAYATSHDLQEPLRKIRILTDRWHSQHKDTINAESRAVLERVVGAAARMQDLVSELMILSSLNADAKKQPCQIRQLIDESLEALKNIVVAKGAVVNIGHLPVIQGYPDQLKLLFRNLLDNALKFSTPGNGTLEISIASRKASGEELSIDHTSVGQYYCISVQDNGIGFSNRQAEKMFGIFRQLHSGQDGYVGKGTGLAICHRIMTNHRGQILAHGFPGEGATFKLYFPHSG